MSINSHFSHSTIFSSFMSVFIAYYLYFSSYIRAMSFGTTKYEEYGVNKRALLHDIVRKEGKLI